MEQHRLIIWRVIFFLAVLLHLRDVSAEDAQRDELRETVLSIDDHIRNVVSREDRTKNGISPNAADSMADVVKVRG